MTSSVRRTRVNAHIPKRGRGRGRRANGEGSSQTTQPTQSQVDDSTRYLNYQDQIHDVTNNDYDDQHISDDCDVTFI